MSKEREVIFDNAIRAADMLHQMFGSICEVAVHDFKDLDRSLIHVAGNLTGRSIGSPATDLVLREYRKKLDEIEDINNYFTVAKNGVRMKSSTVFLRLKGKVIGAFCLNINISTLTDVSKEITEIISADTSGKTKESFFATVQDVVKEMFEQVVAEIGKPIESFGMEEKIGVVRALEERGVFLIKGALEYLSAYLKISKYTTYSYLQKIRAENEYTKK
jgi:predicted transcriptional regulator YheO